MRVVYSKANFLTYNQQRSRLENTLALDERWISFNRPPEKYQARVWLTKGEKPPQVATINKYEPNLMFIFALDCNGIVTYRKMEKGKTVTSQVYLEFLQ